MPEMVKAYVIQGGSRLERGNMSPNIGVFVGAQYHRHRIPTGVGANPMLDILIAW